MCSRYSLNASTARLATELGPLNGHLPVWNPLYSIAPTVSVPIVHRQIDDGDRVLTAARWDWPKPPGVTDQMRNAKIEKLDGAWWRHSFRTARCIVPMTGYFEWTGPKGDKTPHLLSGTDLLSAAGLTRLVDVDGQQERQFIIVTRKGQDAAGDIHPRMPAFLTQELYEAWLDPSPLTDPQARTELLDALDLSSQNIGSTVRSRTVDRRINYVHRIDPRDPTLIA